MKCVTLKSTTREKEEEERKTPVSGLFTGKTGTFENLKRPENFFLSVRLEASESRFIRTSAN